MISLSISSSLRALKPFGKEGTVSTATLEPENTTKLYVDIAIEPVKAVEFIYIPLRLKNTGEIAASVATTAVAG